MKIEQKEREKIVLEKLINEVLAIIRKYRLEDFDILKFESDLKKWMIKILYLEVSFMGEVFLRFLYFIQFLKNGHILK